METELLNRLVKQHAETSRLMGVSFVPVYRAAGGPPAPGGPADLSAPPPEGAGGPPPAPGASAGASPTILEIKPIPPSPIPPGPRTPERCQGLLDALRERYEREAPHRHFITGHTRIVFGEGDPCARLMFVGEAPGAEEDRTGRPFVGRAGQLLEKMLGAMGLRREQVYIVNVLKTRPPDNATPTGDEVRLCAPYLFEQVAIIAPEVIVALGLPATRALLKTADSMSRLRGRWATFCAPPPLECRIPVMPTYHPAFLLRSYTAENRGKVWSDLRMVMDRLGLAPAKPPPGGGDAV
ncbi:MAG: uracil-DNA glycosylase [Phycisphaerales bacterium]